MTTILTTFQTVLVEGVGRVVVTEPERDEAGDMHKSVREIRVFAGPDELGPPVFILRLEGDDAEAIALTAPEQRF